MSFTAADTNISAAAQWQVSTDHGLSYNNIPGANDTTYNTSVSILQNGFQYRAIFSYNGRSDTTAGAPLTVWPPDTAQYNPIICFGQSLTVGVHTYTASGTYIDNLSGASVHGCDSVVITHLTILPLSTLDSISQTICYGQSVNIGLNIYNSSGLYLVTLPGAAMYGCDSIVSLDLFVYSIASDTIMASICPGQSYPMGAKTYSTAGTYIDTLAGQSVYGCDSFTVLKLTLYSSANNTITAVTCPGSGYVFGSYTYTITGSYTDTLVSSSIYGCDSIITLDLVVLDSSLTSYFSVQPSSLPYFWYAINQCSGNQLSYVWNWGDGSPNSTGDTPSHAYDTAGYYTICVTVIDSMGCSATYCDSNIHLFKDQSGQMIYLTVIHQNPNGINSINATNESIGYHSGAIHFSEAISSPSDLALYDLSGRVVMNQNNFIGNFWNINSDTAAGVYIIRLQNGNYSITKKIVITK